jgi:putative SOS response-associated peptidase YedK
MCNLYSITTNQAANTDTGRELSMMRWGMPPPPKYGGPPVTNIRNTSSPHWRGLLKPENRCLVPDNSFAEYAPEPNPEAKKKDVVWFPLNEDRRLFAFAGIWTTFNGDRGTSQSRCGGRIRSMVFSRHRRTRSSRQSIPRQCR